MIFMREFVLASCLALAGATYGAVVLVRGFGPVAADLEIGFTAGPVVLFLAVWTAAEEWRRRAGVR